MNVSELLHAERLLVKRYERRGYVVKRGPTPADIPFPLHGYLPDLLAMKGDEHLLLDIAPKGTPPSGSTEKVQSELRQHPGWHWTFITLAQDDLRYEGLPRIGRGGGAIIQSRLQALDRNIDDEAMAPVILIGLWPVYAAVLELALRSVDEKVDGLNDLSILQRACSLGIVSWDDHDVSKRLEALRDQASHKVDTVVTSSQCRQLRRITATVFSQYLAEVPS